MKSLWVTMTPQIILQACMFVVGEQVEAVGLDLISLGGMKRAPGRSAFHTSFTKM